VSSLHAQERGQSVHEGKKSVTAPKSATRFEVLKMAARDLPAAQVLSHAVNWPHRLEDWQFVHSMGEGLVAYSGDQLVGTAMWWTYDRRIVRLGMVIVDPTIQRSGIGRALMLGTLDRITEPTVLLNATKQGEPLYRQLGFQGIGSIVQHQGTSLSVPPAPLRAGERIRPLDRNDPDRLIELDAVASGGRRDGVIAALIANGEAIVLDHAGETVGFAFCRRFGRGHLIGPVVARDTAGARALIAHWIGSNAGTLVRIDAPGESGLSDWLEELGLARVGAAVTMVRGAPPKLTGRFHVFGAVNQALG
jgi:GNAT superfamily N-acetyltransferase